MSDTPQWCKNAAMELRYPSSSWAEKPKHLSTNEQRWIEQDAAIIAQHAPQPAQPGTPYNGHTELPWSIQDCSHGGKVLLRGTFGAHQQSHVQIVPGEDAAFILHACNSYYQREQALRACVEALDGFLGIVSESEGVIGWHLNGDVLKWEQCDQILEMHAALAQAREVLK